jgi:hypothetical protein
MTPHSGINPAYLDGRRLGCGRSALPTTHERSASSSGFVPLAQPDPSALAGDHEEVVGMLQLPAHLLDGLENAGGAVDRTTTVDHAPRGAALVVSDLQLNLEEAETGFLRRGGRTHE